MSFRSTFLAATAFLASVNAHIIMKSPVPYAKDKIDNSPIQAKDFPCKQTLGYDNPTSNNMAVGEKQTISFTGTAVHGGGLCQLSVTTDPKPSANSVFKVIKTIEGGCPGTDGATKDFEFELPDSIPNGEGSFAWTWMPVSSGGPEYYMNCARITVTGGASDDSKFKELPDMLVANLQDINTCKQVANTILQAPNPGQVVENNAGSTPLQAPTGQCGATGNSPPAEGGSSVAGQPASSAPAQQPASSAPAGQPSAAPSNPAGQPSAVPSNPGGVFAPSASSAALPQSTLTTLVTVTAAPSAPAPSAPAVAPSVPVGTGTPAQPSSPASGGGSSSCSQNGAVVCNGPDQFGLCNNGKVVWQQVAAGTTCSNGSIQKRGYNGRVARPRAVVPGKDFTPGS